ncbi:MAG: penicillin-binding protein 1A [Fidelibacterota bacterium]
MPGRNRNISGIKIRKPEKKPLPLKIKFLISFLISLIILIIFFVYIRSLTADLPSLAQLEHFDPELVTRIYSANGEVINELYTQRRVLIPLEKLPHYMAEAVIATEDHRFWDHWGLSSRDIVRALLIDLIALGKRQGASTLTQQLARNLYLNMEKTIIRKVKEVLTAIEIERTYSKREILEMYLNSIYFGHGAYGVQAAARRYFSKRAEDLNLQEASLLAALLPAPARYSPFIHPDKALKRRNLILRNMKKFGYISEAEYDSVSRLPIELQEPEEIEGIAPYFAEYVRLKLEEEKEKLGIDIYRDGLSIYTTLDTRIQAIADSAVKSHIYKQQAILNNRLLNSDEELLRLIDTTRFTLDSVKAMIQGEIPVDSTLRSKLIVQTALIAIDPRNGHILAMIGGRDFNMSKFNRATQARRQPGSVFKPFLYTAVIDNGYPVTTQILNQPVVLFIDDTTKWSPRNYDRTMGGLVTLREGLKRSLNLVSVRLVQELVPPAMVVEYAKKMGITTNIRAVDAIALGTSEVIPLEVTSAYAIFANRGVWVQPIAITRIEDRFGNVIREYSPLTREVLSEETAYIMTDLMRTVIDEGTGASARWKYRFYRPAGGKTGTTDSFTDAWFVGFTPQIAAGVWVGLDDPQVSLGENQPGAIAALPIWAKFMKTVYDSLNIPYEDFEQPDGVIELEVCKETKKLPTPFCPTEKEIFNKKYVPTERCDIHTGIKEKKRSSKVEF